MRQAQSAIPSNEFLTVVVEAFNALADPTRARILCALGRQILYVRDLAIVAGISESTMSYKLRLLRDHHVVKAQRNGATMYYSVDDQHVAARRVTQPLVWLTDFVEDMAEAGLRPESRVLSFAPETAPAEIAAVLGLEPNAEVYRLDRLRPADDIPIALDWTWLPLQFGRLLLEQDLTRRTIYSILEREYGIPVVSGEYILAAAVADAEQAGPLHVPVRAPVLVFDRTTRTSSDKPVYVQKRFYRADRVQYRLSLNRTAPGESAIQSFGPVFGRSHGL